MGFGRESNYGALGFKATRGSRARHRFFPINPISHVKPAPLWKHHLMARISSKQADSRLNIIPPATMLLCVRASASVHSFARWCLFRSRTVGAEFCHSPIRFPALSLRPLDCIDHRWRGCTRRKRLVYSSASYRYVNGESRSR